MATISEDYVSFETAKLLKEKGFDQNCPTYYLDGQVWRHYHCEVIPKGKPIFAAPTQSVASKWIREVHKLNIEVYRTASGYIACIVKIPSGTDLKFLETDGDDLASGTYTTYEKAIEAGIQYCLEHLI